MPLDRLEHVRATRRAEHGDHIGRNGDTRGHLGNSERPITRRRAARRTRSLDELEPINVSGARQHIECPARCATRRIGLDATTENAGTRAVAKCMARERTPLDTRRLTAWRAPTDRVRRTQTAGAPETTPCGSRAGDPEIAHHGAAENDGGDHRRFRECRRRSPASPADNITRRARWALLGSTSRSSPTWAADDPGYTVWASAAPLSSITRTPAPCKTRNDSRSRVSNAASRSPTRARAGASDPGPSPGIVSPDDRAKSRIDHRDSAFELRQAEEPRPVHRAARQLSNREHRSSPAPPTAAAALLRAECDGRRRTRGTSALGRYAGMITRRGRAIIVPIPCPVHRGDNGAAGGKPNATTHRLSLEPNPRSLDGRRSRIRCRCSWRECRDSRPTGHGEPAARGESRPGPTARSPD